MNNPLSEGTIMRPVRAVVIVLSALVLVVLTACGASQQEKDFWVQHAKDQNFTEVTPAPDRGSDDGLNTIHISVRYKGCSLILYVDGDNTLKYNRPTDVLLDDTYDNVSSVYFDTLEAFKPCRDNAIGARPSTAWFWD